MPAKKPAEPFEPAAALLGALATNHRITIYLVENLPDAAWRAEPPGGKGRDIASIVAHIHNVRGMWLKVAGGKVPGKLDRHTVTKPQAMRALEESAKALDALLRQSLAAGGRIKNFKPDAVGFVGYLVAHDAHHRGQITMLARQCGHPISQSTMFGMWEWGKF